MTAPAARIVEVDTPLGPARAHLLDPPGARPSHEHPVAGGPAGPGGTLVLGHGAGGGIGAPDLTAAAAAALAGGWRTILVEQPWRVAGRRVAPAPAQLDTGWRAVLAALADLLPEGAGGPLVVGGRSAGARVACRTAAELGARSVLALAFPLHPPGRPERSRAVELEQAGVPVVAVQGRRDPFGTPEEVEALGLAHVRVVAVDGDHALRVRSTAGPGVAAATSALLSSLMPSGPVHDP